MLTPMTVKRQLQTLLLSGETEKLLRTLTVLADQLGDNRLMNEVVHQQSQYEAYRKAPSKEKLARIHHALGLLIERMV